MPTLQFKGKNIIWNHHLSVPYHALDDVSKLLYKTEKANGNLIIEGDNLLALKALLPLYAGHIKCIYIDPPYNTGNEKWAYNDNVNSPLLKDWLGKEVAKDDLTRHDKWLCMMTPRLKLLRELLSEDGAIFISIDDNEIHNLREIQCKARLGGAAAVNATRQRPFVGVPGADVPGPGRAVCAIANGRHQCAERVTRGIGIAVSGGALRDQPAAGWVLEGGFVERLDVRSEGGRIGVDEPALRWGDLGEGVDVDR